MANTIRIVLAAALVGLVSLAACGGDDTSVDAGVTADAGPSSEAGSSDATDAGSSDATDAGSTDDSRGGAVVTTTQGPVQGHIDGPLLRFLGIPYAEPPVGNLRWRAPRVHAPWTTTFDAGNFGAACPQGVDLTGQTTTWDEDCLSLNVWTSRTGASAKLPVMVFIHGGAFRNGASSKSLYDGHALAVADNMVFVSINYRLGDLGFTAHPALSAEDEHQSSGNYGLLDQVAALRWVRDNIAAFGGDPAAVTIFGESAGSMSVCTHIASPLSAGLFYRALGESGSCLSFVTPLHTQAGTPTSAESKGEAFAKTMQCDTAPDVIACLRAKSAADIIAVATSPTDDVGLAATMPQPNVDGYLLTETPATAFLAGRFNKIDAFVGGTNLDEATLFTRTKTLDTIDDFKTAVTAIVPAHVDDATTLYPPMPPSYATPRDAYNAFITDLTFVCRTKAQLRMFAAGGVRTYLYRFEKLTAFGRASKLGVYHASELPFVFGNLSDTSGTAADAVALSGAMMGDWTRFAITGDPNAASAATWPAFTANSDAYLAIDDVSKTGTALYGATCDAMAAWATAP